MHLIVGLGNPGKKYRDTRHNAGFLALEYLRELWNFPEFHSRDSCVADTSEGRLGRSKVILARPETYMNLSGNSVRAIARFFKISPDHIAIIHDDLDIALGTIRTSFDSRSAGHRGVQSIIETLGTTAFFRFRIGIGHPRNPSQESQEDPARDTERFVLDPFSSDERAQVISLFPALARNLDRWIRGQGTGHPMS